MVDRTYEACPVQLDVLNLEERHALLLVSMGFAAAIRGASGSGTNIEPCDKRLTIVAELF